MAIFTCLLKACRRRASGPPCINRGAITEKALSLVHGMPTQLQLTMVPREDSLPPVLITELFVVKEMVLVVKEMVPYYIEHCN